MKSNHENSRRHLAQPVTLHGRKIGLSSPLPSPGDALNVCFMMHIPKKEYNNPKWKKRRLDILKRDKYTCRSCGASSCALHVHHRWYLSGRKAWEYPDVALVSMCPGCHHEYGPSTLEKESFEATIEFLTQCGFNMARFGVASYYADIPMDVAMKIFVDAFNYRIIDRESFAIWKEKLQELKKNDDRYELHYLQ